MTDRVSTRIALATDLAEPGLFQTALGLTLAARAGGPVDLYVLHVGDLADWRRHPTVRDALVRWGVLTADADVETFKRLGFHVRAVPLSPQRGELRDVLVGELHMVDPDLVVLGTQGHVGLDRLLHPSVAEPVARAALVPTLLVRAGTGRLVDVDTGALRLRRVVVPLDTRLPVQPVIDTVVGLVGRLGASPVHFRFVHVGGAKGLPDAHLPERADWLWSTERVDGGGVVDGILEVAAAADADLIAMGTSGHDSLLDALRGSRTERVLRRAPCPVLAVPL